MNNRDEAPRKRSPRRWPSRKLLVPLAVALMLAVLQRGFGREPEANGLAGSHPSDSPGSSEGSGGVGADPSSAPESLALRITAQENMLRRNPAALQPQLILGETYYRLGQDVSARFHLEQYLAKAAPGADSLRGAMLQARVLLRLGLHNRATQALQHLVRRPGAPPGASHDLSVLLRGDQFPVEAVMAEMRAAEVSGAAAPYLREGAAQWKEMGIPEEALTLVAPLAESEEGSAEDQFLLGYLSHRVGALDRARAAYEAALQLDPGDPEAHYNLALLLEGDGEIDSAAYHLEEVLRLRPHYEPAYFQLASLFLRASRKGEAEATFRRFLLAGSDSLALSEAAGILRALGAEER